MLGLSAAAVCTTPQHTDSHPNQHRGPPMIRVIFMTMDRMGRDRSDPIGLIYWQSSPPLPKPQATF